MVLPVVIVMTFAVVAVGIALRNEIVVELAAREGARAAAVSSDPAAAASAAASRAVDLPVTVATRATATTVTVTVTYVDDVDVAIIGWVLGPVTHRASVTMAAEPPGP